MAASSWFGFGSGLGGATDPHGCGESGYDTEQSKRTRRLSLTGRTFYFTGLLRTHTAATREARGTEDVVAAIACEADHHRVRASAHAGFNCCQIR